MDRPLAQVLQAAAAEAADLSQAAERLQWLAGDLIRRAGSGGDQALVEEAQGLDALAQKLSALAGFLQRIGEDAPAEWRLDIAAALAAVPLSDMANRLGHKDAAPSWAVASVGECELF
jgi:hypothetical protein